MPYVTLAVVVIGTWWRYRYDKFGWTTRSSQLYESRLLHRQPDVPFRHPRGDRRARHRPGDPESWTRAVGLSEHGYHLQAVILGTIAGLSTLVGIALLIYRRRTRGPVFGHHRQRQAHVRRAGGRHRRRAVRDRPRFRAGRRAYDYRQSVSIWFRSIWILQPRGDLMAGAPLYYQVHVMIGLMLFALWPFTRLVHAFSADRLSVPALRRLPQPRYPPGRADRLSPATPGLVIIS